MSYELIKMKGSVIREKSFGFDVRIVGLSKQLQEKKMEFILSKQLLRSETRIGAKAQSF